MAALLIGAGMVSRIWRKWPRPSIFGSRCAIPGKRYLMNGTCPGSGCVPNARRRHPGPGLDPRTAIVAPPTTPASTIWASWKPWKQKPLRWRHGFEPNQRLPAERLRRSTFPRPPSRSFMPPWACPLVAKRPGNCHRDPGRAHRRAPGPRQGARIQRLILAAGAGRRFGADKRRARLSSGETLLEATLSVLCPADPLPSSCSAPRDGAGAIPGPGPSFPPRAGPRGKATPLPPA